jgi:signal transduction histidine kinase
MPQLLRTNAFRLAALYFVLFAASVLALLIFIYVSTANFIKQQTEATIEAEAQGLREQFEQRQTVGLLQIVQDRSATEQGALYIVTDSYLHKLTGNLPQWPTVTQLAKGWVTFPTPVKTATGTETITALAQAYILPNGFHLLVGRDLRDATAFRERITRTLGWSALITLALGVAGGVFMTRHMLARVEAVNRTSAHIIHGDLSQRVPVSGSGDEFDQLAGNLNAMLDQIERLMVGMRQVTDNIAHDLRTPLSRLRSRLEVTLLEKPDPQRYADALRETIAEADHLLGTFNALLSIAEAEAGSRRDGFAIVDLAEIARSVVELYEPVAEEAGQRLTVDAEAALPVRGDRHLLSQSLANLLDNALKYAPSGEIAVTAEAVGSTARVAVADHGPGIPDASREAVLDRFVRLEGSRSTPGNGLGLSLVRAVATMHGGSIRLADNKPGLKAVLTFPLAAAAPSSGPPVGGSTAEERARAEREPALVNRLTL